MFWRRLLVLLMMMASGLWFFPKTQPIRSMNQAVEIKIQPTLQLHIPQQALIQRAFETMKPSLLLNGITSSTRLAIVPHHLLAALDLATFFSLAPKWKTLYIVSPDHFSQGKTAFTTVDQNLTWSGEQGTSTIAVDADRVAALHEHDPSLMIDPKPFLTEHGIYSLLPFLHKTNPDVRIVPIIVRIDATSSELEALTQLIKQDLEHDPSAGLIASIDMSHYQIQEVADFHDILTQMMIKKLDTDRIPKAEIDSPGSMFIVLSLAKQLGLEAWLHTHTNSLVIDKALLERESTSHIIASFRPWVEESSFIRKDVTTFWHQLPKIPTTEDRLYHGFDEAKEFSDPSLPYFFGVWTWWNEEHGKQDGAAATMIWPFPFDKQRQLLTREQRRDQIKRDEAKIRAWVEKNIRPDSYQLVY